MERLRAVHLQMVDAVLTGDGLERVAQLAAAATGGAGRDRRPPAGGGGGVRARAWTPAPLRRYVAERMRDRAGAGAAGRGRRGADRARATTRSAP